MGNYASKDGSDDANHIHDSIPSRNAGGGSSNVRSFRAEEHTQRPTDEQALVLEGDMDNSVRLNETCLYFILSTSPSWFSNYFSASCK